MVRNDDTIAAVATAPGPAAIAVIRISGAAAIRIAATCFRGKVPLEDARSQAALHGRIVGESGGTVDEVVATVYRSPRSYTGEDVVEISCHGGMLIVDEVLDALCRCGARVAEAGEFTRRAFLNGKMDLSQAEAVMEMVTVQSRASARVAVAQLEGRLGRVVGELRRKLVDLCALLELELDFAEESLELVGSEETRRRLEGTALEVSKLCETFSEGKRIREGLSVVLTGKPNAGKSSLFNALLRESRAIVTPIPGTTRDTLEETVELQGYLFRLSDTAGIRPTEDVIEREGVERSLRAKAGADVVLVVEDPSDPIGANELQEFVQNLDKSQVAVRVLNKADLLNDSTRDQLLHSESGPLRSFLVSAKTGEGLKDLEGGLARIVAGGETAGREPVLLINKRHYEAFRRAASVLRAAYDNWELYKSNELAAIDIREAANALGEITGEITSEDILNSIFSKFCIGK